MKSIRLFAAFAVTLAAIACNKEQAAPDQEIDTQEPQNEITDVPEGYVRLTFSTPAETKTSIDKESGAVSWSEHDQIKICWEGGSAVSDEVSIEGGVARFTANVAEAAEDLYAVYPSGLTASVSSGTLSVDIPQSQSGRFADADIIVAKTTKTELTYAFHHAVSLVRFVISDGNSRSITRAQFVDLANNSCLYGTLGITFSGTDINEITEPTTEANDVIDITAVAEGDNWIAVPPTKSLTGYGLRMGTSSAWLPGIVGEKPYAFSAAGKRLGLGTVDSKINDGDWYIKPEATGTGDGKSWENAGGPAMLQSLMGEYVSGADGDTKFLARAWRVNGKTIKVAEGNYSASNDGGFMARYSGGETVTFTIEGGYTDSGAISSSAKPVFGVTSGEAEAKRAFMFYGTVNITLNDVVVSKHTRTGAGGGAAVYATDGANLSISNSTFSDNKITTHNGGAIRFTGPGTLSLSQCTFTGNTAVGTAANNNQGRGGAIYTDASATLEMEECLFNGNVGRNGGAIAVSETTLKATICKFIGNHNDGTAYYNSASNGRTGSGTIAAFKPSGGSESVAFFNACEFRNNYAVVTSNGNKQAGNITFSDSACVWGFNNCLFLNNGNNSSTYKPIWSIYSNSSVMLVNSTVVDDVENNGGPSQGMFLSNTASVIYNNVVINKGGFAIRTSDNFTHDFNVVSSFTSNGTAEANYHKTNEVKSDSLGEALAYEYNTHANGKTAGVTTGMSYYYWNGTSPTFGPTTKSGVATAIGTSSDFYTWLDSLVAGSGTALDTDIRGVSRSTDYWPGSFQNN